MKLFRRIARLLWRDEGKRDPWTHKASSDYNRSLLGRFKELRYRNPNALWRFLAWIGPAVIASAATLGAVWLADYLNSRKTGDEVQTNAGELLMQCVEQEHGVYRCRKLTGGNDEVIAGPHDERGQQDLAPQQPANDGNDTAAAEK